MTAPSTWSHGKHSTYCAGCRCEPCRTAHREHMARWRAGATKVDPTPRLPAVPGPWIGELLEPQHDRIRRAS